MLSGPHGPHTASLSALSTHQLTCVFAHGCALRRLHEVAQGPAAWTCSSCRQLSGGGARHTHSPSTATESGAVPSCRRRADVSAKPVQASAHSPLSLCACFCAQLHQPACSGTSSTTEHCAGHMHPRGPERPPRRHACKTPSHKPAKVQLRAQHSRLAQTCCASCLYRQDADTSIRHDSVELLASAIQTSFVETPTQRTGHSLAR